MNKPRQVIEWLEVPVDEEDKARTSSEYGCIVSLPGEDPHALHVVEFNTGKRLAFPSRRDEELSEDIMVGSSFDGDTLFRLIKEEYETMFSLNVDGFREKRKGERIIYVDLNRMIGALEVELGCCLDESYGALGRVINKHVALVGTGVCWVNHAKEVGEVVHQANTISDLLHLLWQHRQLKGKETNDSRS